MNLTKTLNVPVFPDSMSVPYVLICYIFQFFPISSLLEMRRDFREHCHVYYYMARDWWSDFDCCEK